MKLNLDYSTLKKNDVFAKDYQKKVREITEKLQSPDHSAGTTWVDWPENYNEKEFQKIQKVAKEIRKNSDALLVIGIGGSFLGAKSGLNILASKSKVEIIFAGISFDYSELSEKLESLKDKDITVNVVSKSGTTLEILAALQVVEKFLKNKYKNDYKSRLIFTTDANKGYLRERANKERIEAFVVPDNMGGRYSVLSAVGLLPFAVAGVNIKKILEGASMAMNDFKTPDVANNIALQYAIYRHLINKKLDKKVELFSTFSHKFMYFGYWLQQLFCESEGKDGEGLFVIPLVFSRDLHSVGQFIQQGTPLHAETFIKVDKYEKDYTLSNIVLGSPIKYLDGKNYSDISDAAYDGTIKAHADAKVPIAIISIDEINEQNYGYMVYFFEYACAVSGYLLKVNPFNQPGVEQYKAYMKENLKK